MLIWFWSNWSRQSWLSLLRIEPGIWLRSALHTALCMDGKMNGWTTMFRYKPNAGSSVYGRKPWMVLSWPVGSCMLGTSAHTNIRKRKKLGSNPLKYSKEINKHFLRACIICENTMHSCVEYMYMWFWKSYYHEWKCEEHIKNYKSWVPWRL